MALAAEMILAPMPSFAKNRKNMENSIKIEKLHLTKKWDKVFPQSDKVDHSKVTFVNRYGITLAADIYKPKNASGKLPALAVSGPFGAVKEQSSGLYAQTMAQRGFLAIAFDPSLLERAAGSLVSWHPQTSTRKTSAQLWTIYPAVTTWIRSG